MSKGKKIALIVAIVAVVVIVGLAIIIPALLNVDRYRPQVIAQIQRETGKPAQIGRLDLTILPRVAIRVDDFSLGNPAGFPSGDFVKAKKIDAVINASALWNHKVEITSLELDDLVVNMLENSHSKWNFENPPSSSAPPANSQKEGSASFTLGVISKLTIVRGEFAAASLLESGAPGPALIEVHGATINLHDVNFDALSSASLRPPASPPGELARLSSWFGTIAYAADPEGPPVAHGDIRSDSMQFGTLVVTKLDSKFRLFPKQVFLDDLKLKCYGGSVTGNFSLDFGAANLAYTVDAKMKGVDVAGLLNAFPQARGMMTGTMEGSAMMQGQVTHSSDPLAGITGSGQPNGEIRKLANASRGVGTGHLGHRRAHDGRRGPGPRRARARPGATCAPTSATRGYCLEPATTWGVVAADATSLTARISVRTPAAQRDLVTRALRAGALRNLHDAGLLAPEAPEPPAT